MLEAALKARQEKHKEEAIGKKKELEEKGKKYFKGCCNFILHLWSFDWLFFWPKASVDVDFWENTKQIADDV